MKLQLGTLPSSSLAPAGCQHRVVRRGCIAAPGIAGRRPTAGRVHPQQQQQQTTRRSRHGVARRALEGGEDKQQAPAIAAERLDLPFESDMQSFSGGSTAAAVSAGGGAILGPTPVPSGTLINSRYKVESVLGRGANATAYLATDTTSGRQVALKAMSLKGLKDWKQLELFQREAVVLKSLSHPGIPQYIDYFEQDSASDRAFYIVQEVVQGASLAEMVSGGARASEDEVCRIATDLLATLKYLAGLRPPVIHRDIKPENVVLEGGRFGGRVFLVDFGGVQGAAAAGEVPGSTIVGTYGYMAPEQFTGQATPASDLYSLGATLLYLVSGQPPGAFPTKRMRIDFKDKVTVGPRLGELLDGLLEPLAEDRVTPQEALDIITGKADRRRKKAAAQQQTQRQQPQAAAAGGMVRLRDGSLYQPAYMPKGRVRKPAGTRVELENSGGRLDIDIPPQRLGSQNIGTGLFALAWNAFVAFWTFSAIASGGVLFALFSAPFWFAGYQLAGQALGGALTHERFAIGKQRWRLAQELALLKNGATSFQGPGGARAKQAEGELRDLTGARVVTTLIVNGVPQTAIELVEGVRTFRFGESLAAEEQVWLVSEINAKIAEVKGSAPTLDDMPPEDAPEMYDDTDPTSSAISDIDPFFTRDRADPFRDRDQFFDRRK